MTTCAACNRQIKNVYLWEGRELGIECWKKLALPAIIAERDRREEERLAARRAKSEMIASVLAAKDLSRITNPFKRSFVPSIVSQARDGHMLSNRQMEIAFSLFSKADNLRYDLLRVACGEISLERIADHDYQSKYKGKLVGMVTADFGALPEQEVFWLERMRADKAYKGLSLTTPW